MVLGIGIVVEGEPPYLQGAVTIEVCERRGIKELWADRSKDLGTITVREGPRSYALCMGPFVLVRLQSKSSVWTRLGTGGKAMASWRETRPFS